MNRGQLERDIVYCKMELARERNPDRRIWLLTRIRDAERDLLELSRAERQMYEGFNSNLEKAVELALAKRRKDAEK